MSEGSAGVSSRRTETVRAIHHHLGLPPGGSPRARDGGRVRCGSRGFGWGSRWCGSERTRAYLSVVLRCRGSRCRRGRSAVVLRDANLADVARAHRGEPAVRARRGRPLGDAHRVTGDRAGGLTEHRARENERGRRRVRRARRCGAPSTRYFKRGRHVSQATIGAQRASNDEERDTAAANTPPQSNHASNVSTVSHHTGAPSTRVYNLSPPQLPPLTTYPRRTPHGPGLAARSSSVGSVATTFPVHDASRSSARLILLCAST